MPVLLYQTSYCRIKHRLQSFAVVILERYKQIERERKRGRFLEWARRILGHAVVPTARIKLEGYTRMADD